MVLHKKRIEQRISSPRAVRWCSFKSVWWRWCSVTGLGESVCSWWWCRVHSSTQFGYTTTIIVLRFKSKSQFELGRTLESDLDINWSADWEIVQSKPRRLRDKRKLKKQQGSSSNARVIERQSNDIKSMSLHQSSSNVTQQNQQNAAQSSTPNQTGQVAVSQSAGQIVVQQNPAQVGSIQAARTAPAVQATSAGLTIEQISCVCDVLQEPDWIFIFMKSKKKILLNIQRMKKLIFPLRPKTFFFKFSQ